MSLQPQPENLPLATISLPARPTAMNRGRSSWLWLTSFVLAGAFSAIGFAPVSRAAEESSEIAFLPGESWWAGIISRAHQMPFTAESSFEFDFLGNAASNQAQPLLISDKGRYVWSEEPFRFRFDKGLLRLWAEPDALQVGTNGASLKEAYQHASRSFFPASGKIPDELLFTRPQFNTWIELTYDQNQKDVLAYARAVVAKGYPPGVLMIDEGWARNYGEWDFDPGRFPDPKAMIKELHELGFKVMLWVVPYITPDGQYFKELWLDQQEKGLTPWIPNPDKPGQPSLIKWWNGFSAVADFTNPYANEWFKARLDHLVNTYGIDGFKFDGGDPEQYVAANLVTPGRAMKAEATPNQHCELFARIGLDYPLNEYRACWKMGGQALAQRLQDKAHNWDDSRKLLPHIIAQGLMGYAFTCPDMIGGGEYLSFRNLDKVDQELVVRGAQCHALMPMMQFSVAPWRILNEENQQHCLAMAKLHSDMGAEIVTLARDAARSGEPIVRSLDYQFPGNGYANVTDQYLLGASILVAPVLEKGARTRKMHFPPGEWKGDDGSVVRGPSVQTVDAPLGRLPWYRKQREND